MLPVTLQSERLLLDIPTRADVAAITAGCRDEAVVTWTTAPSPYTEHDARMFVDALVGPGWASDREYTFAIRRQGSGALHGVVSFRTPHHGIGFWLDSESRGNGITPEAAGMVIDWVFSMGYPDVTWECNVGNIASATVARKCGFVYTGTETGRLPLRDGSPATVWTGIRRSAGGYPDTAPASALTPAGPAWPAESFAHN